MHEDFLPHMHYQLLWLAGKGHWNFTVTRSHAQRPLELVNTKINGAAMTLPAGLPAGFPMAIFASSGDEKPFYRAELRALSTSIAAALARTADRTTRVHLEGARDQIARILDPKFAPMQ